MCIIEFVGLCIENNNNIPLYATSSNKNDTVNTNDIVSIPIAQYSV